MLEPNILLVNATAAKQTGAKSIVEKFCFEKSFHEYSKVYVVGPMNLEITNPKIIHVKISTSGIGTYLYSLVGILYHVIKYKAGTIFSFSNLNMIFPLGLRITYFHQKLVFSQKTIYPISPTLIKFTLKYFDSSDRYIVQNHEIKELLNNLTGSKSEILVKWPGYRPCAVSRLNDEYLDNQIASIKAQGYKYLAVVPIYDISKPHKNFAMLKKFAPLFKEKKVALICTSEISPDYVEDNGSCLFFVGFLSRCRLDYLYHKADFMVFPSREETLGLPIFEFASTGKVTMVKKEKYLNGNPYIESNPSNIILFDEESLEQKLDESLGRENNVSDLSKKPFTNGDWSFK